MEENVIVFVFIGIIIFLGIFFWILEIFSNSKKYIELKPQFDTLDRQREDHEIRVKKFEEALIIAKKDIDKITRQRSMGFPWLASAYADYFALRDIKREEYLKTKKHPAYTAAETVREIKDEKRELVKENRIIKYKINYFEKLFPWLNELIAEDEEDITANIASDTMEDSTEDTVKAFLTPEEYRNLSSVERNQTALDRYLKNRNKSKWAIGRDYEMYVGYIFKQKGYSIEYKGIVDGFDDLGRDLIATKNKEVCIIQCKYWAQYKNIHEKHIFQLFGTTMEYWIQNFNQHGQKSFSEFTKYLNDNRLRPIFYTSASLSDRARSIARALNINVLEGQPIGEFPRIKCNVNNEQFGTTTKIYHLPMDQQYDKTIIGNQPGEFYAFTVKEAEDAGFRRAFKHNF